MSSQRILLHIKNFGFPNLLHQCFKREWGNIFRYMRQREGKDKEEIYLCGKSMRWEIISPLLAVLPLLHLQIVWGGKEDPKNIELPFLFTGYWIFLSLTLFYINANLETTQFPAAFPKSVNLLTHFHMGMLEDQECTALHSCSSHQTISWALQENLIPCAMLWHFRAWWYMP